MIKSATSKARKNGKTAFDIVSMEIFARFDATKRFNATGGVIVPIERFRAITTPNHVKPQLKYLMIGIMMGVKIYQIETPSIKHPATRRIPFIIIRTQKGSVDTVSIAAAAFSMTPNVEPVQPRSPANATMIIKIPEESAESLTTS